MKDPNMDALIEKMEGTLSEAEAEGYLTEIYRYLYHHYNHLAVVDLDLPYAANQRVAKWDLGGAVWDQNFIYLIRP
jgi:hypothetical protein